MKPTTFIHAVVLLALLLTTAHAQSLLDQFQSPPDTTRVAAVSNRHAIQNP